MHPRPFMGGKALRLDYFGSSISHKWNPPLARTSLGLVLLLLFAAGPNWQMLQRAQAERCSRMESMGIVNILPSSPLPPPPSSLPSHTLTRRYCLQLISDTTTCAHQALVRVCRAIFKPLLPLPLLRTSSHGTYDHSRARSSRSIST